jgi:hypothetical protein
MAKAKDMRAALIEALDLFAYEFTYQDGRLIVDHHTNEPRSSGGCWVKQAREALGLDPISGKRPPRNKRTRGE